MHSNIIACKIFHTLSRNWKIYLNKMWMLDKVKQYKTKNIYFVNLFSYFAVSVPENTSEIKIAPILQDIHEKR